MGGSSMAGVRRLATPRRLAGVVSVVWTMALLMGATSRAAQEAGTPASGIHDQAFQTSHECVACHNGLTTPSGEDVSIGSAWRASMMANSARDPYWQAAVRREIADHPEAQAAIEDECSICHMPMTTTLARASGGHGEIFAHLPVGGTSELERLAADGVSCTACHQIGPERLGTPESFTGGYVINLTPAGQRSMYGPFEIPEGRAAMMRSATGVTPAEGAHIRQSEVCATCHTLFTDALDDGKVVGRLPEQTPYLEWRHSAFRDERSCQSCHMPVVPEPTPVASVVGEPREGMARHTFIGANFFMLRMLNRFRAELGVEALPGELEAAAQATVRHLETQTATLEVTRPETSGGRVRFDVAVANLTGHKLPTGYPSRRTWLHVTVRDASGRPVFESGAISPDGSIAGNDNDTDPARYEPHRAEVRSPDEVPIYETILRDVRGAVTTGLLSGTAYLKDNRLLPRGFDKASAPADIAVLGDAARDADFAAGGDRVRYDVAVGAASGPFTVDAVLRYQPISFRWANNLRSYEAAETRRFVSYYDSMSAGSSSALARATARTE